MKPGIIGPNQAKFSVRKNTLRFLKEPALDPVLDVYGVWRRGNGLYHLRLVAIFLPAPFQEEKTGF
jgi:hypothetical protein